ncbi:glycoside hydrolase family 25 protein [Chachezhania sediminis]|uniref:glycoside hydrolase family 25 protein n=1 Tax=Chachezhania sediminis TaxID=2599291 RepID=UPI00131D92F8|nr:GH25 family lysozyme [Chachezhania sediminis]
MTARIFMFLTCLVLAACGGGRGSVPSIIPVDYGDNAFGDSDPVDWGRNGPSAYPIHGIDISRFQSAIDWNAARAAGVRFAFIKATEGGDLFDPMFDEHRKGARHADIPWGAYHFYYWCRPAEEQARWFIRNVPRDSRALTHVLDMEWTPFSPTCTIRPPGATVRAEAKKFLDILEQHYGSRPIIYTTPDFFDDTGIGQLADTEFWVRSVTKMPHEHYGRKHWRFWQYTSTGIVPGIRGDVDINVFYGSHDDWMRWQLR